MGEAQLAGLRGPWPWNLGVILEVPLFAVKEKDGYLHSYVVVLQSGPCQLDVGSLWQALPDDLCNLVRRLKRQQQGPRQE